MIKQADDSGGLTQFRGENYLSLETFRKNGQGVRTPLWFAENSDHRIFVYTLDGAGKLKRIRNNPHVRIAPCSRTGVVHGTWVDASAEIVTGTAAELGQQLLDKKYFLKRIGNLISRLMGRGRAVIAIALQ